jgi:hypothetical protein
MALILNYRARACIGKHGVNVYPLEGFGVLLGWTSDDGETGHAIAALPVGKTENWYEPSGRFDRIDEALAASTQLFSSWHLRPIGLYCTAYEPDIGSAVDIVINTVPQWPETPWLFLWPVFAGELLIAPTALRLRAGKWHDEAMSTTHAQPESPERNPNRIRTAWNRAWGVLDYGNRHETELRRLNQGANPPQRE